MKLSLISQYTPQSTYHTTGDGGCDPGLTLKGIGHLDFDDIEEVVEVMTELSKLLDDRGMTWRRGVFVEKLMAAGVWRE